MSAETLNGQPVLFKIIDGQGQVLAAIDARGNGLLAPPGYFRNPVAALRWRQSLMDLALQIQQETWPFVEAPAAQEATPQTSAPQPLSWGDHLKGVLQGTDYVVTLQIRPKGPGFGPDRSWPAR